MPSRTPRATAALARKLLYIRLWRGLSQTAILSFVQPGADSSQRALVSQWEKAIREPSRQVLIRYAHFAKVTLEELLIDENELPAHITQAAKAAGAELLLSNDVRNKMKTMKNKDFSKNVSGTAVAV